MLPHITKGYRALLDEADALVESIEASDAILASTGERVTLVDVREAAELSLSGRIPGAVHVPRGMLEFAIDPSCPFFDPAFAQDAKFVFFCAGGWRSALAAHTARQMGLDSVAHIEGGFSAWKAAGGPVTTDSAAP